MIDHVITTAGKLTNKISTIIGYKKDVLNEHLSANFKNVETFVQPELNGTAGAVKAAQKKIMDDEDVLILYGDVPLISHESLKNALNDNHDAVILTMIPKDPFGYGRVLKNDSGLATEIIEEKDASPEQKKINEVFTGIMIIKGEMLLSSLDEVNNNNAAGEYYLTDVIKIASKKGVKINPIIVEETEVLGANTKSELHEIENIFREMKSKDLLEQGITLSDASRVDVRGNVTAGKDCSIDVNVILEGEITLGTNVSIGPNCFLKDVVISDNVFIEASMNTLSLITTSFKKQFGPMETLVPSVISPSKITLTSIEQSFPAVTLPLTSTLDASDKVIPCSSKSLDFISLKIFSIS